MKDSREHELTHLEVGDIGRPHGVRGEMKVRLHFEGSNSLAAVKHVLVVPERGAPRLMAIEAVRGRAGDPILALAEVQGREGAEALKGASLWVSRSELEPLEAGEYYLVDLIGCGVFLGERKLGAITAIRPDPSVDTALVELSDGGSAELPLVDAFLLEVDVERRVVRLTSEDGLLV